MMVIGSKLGHRVDWMNRVDVVWRARSPTDPSYDMLRFTMDLIVAKIDPLVMMG